MLFENEERKHKKNILKMPCERRKCSDIAKLLRGGK